MPFLGGNELEEVANGGLKVIADATAASRGSGDGSGLGLLVPAGVKKPIAGPGGRAGAFSDTPAPFDS